MINVKAKSILLHGGVIDNNPKTLSLTYECLGRQDDATIEMNIQLKNYKDITLFFVKQCENSKSFSLFSTVDPKKQSHLVNYIAHFCFYAILVYVLIMLCKTVINKTISVDNIPMYNTGRNLWNSLVEVVSNRIKGSSSKFKTLYEADV